MSKQNRCHNCEHFIPDERFPKKGLCRALLEYGAVRRNPQRWDNNPRVRLNGTCIACYVREPGPRSTFIGLTQKEKEDLMFTPAFRERNTVLRVIKSIF